jgi:hypothetical protein
MKKVLAFISIALLSSVAVAHHQILGDNPDLYGSSLLDHDSGDLAGQEAQKGEGDLYGSHMANPEDVTPDPNAKVDTYDYAAAQKNYDPDGNRTH